MEKLLIYVYNRLCTYIQISRTRRDVKMNANTKLKVLFLCTGNSCRSQMAEAWARHLKGDIIEAYSAGTEPKNVDPRAVGAMAEAGVDISGQRSKSTLELIDIEFDYVITLCDDAQQACPFFPAKTAVIHRAFDDPPRLSEGARDEEEAMHHYRRIRDEIKAYIETLPESLDDKGLA
jgi:arsenate reductase (thioredoxin)